MRIVAVSSPKGGCGKTTTCVSLAGCLAAEGRRVLVVDLDPQAHATLGFGIAPDDLDRNVANALLGDVPLRDVCLDVGPGISIAPGGTLLSAIEATRNEAGPDRAMRLGELLAETADLGLVVIDCPSHLGVLTLNALCAADTIVAPIETSAYGLRSAQMLLETSARLEDRLGRSFDPRLLATRHDRRKRLARNVLATLRDRYGERVLRTVVRESTRLAEASLAGQPISRFDPRSTGHVDHLSLVLELLVDEGATIERAPPNPPARRSVTLRYSSPEARHVALAGDFNGWQGDRDVTTRRLPDGTWEKRFDVVPGVYQYRFRVDERWEPDPTNPRTARGAAGGVNSVLLVR